MSGDANINRECTYQKSCLDRLSKHVIGSELLLMFHCFLSVLSDVRGSGQLGMLSVAESSLGEGNAISLDSVNECRIVMCHLLLDSLELYQHLFESH
jgi:hypothetical protein